MEFENLTRDFDYQMKTSSFLKRVLPKVDEAFLILPKAPVPNVFSRSQTIDDTLRCMELTEVANMLTLTQAGQSLGAHPTLLRATPKMRARGTPPPSAGSAHSFAQDPVALNQEMLQMHVQLKETLDMVQGELAGEQSQYTAILEQCREMAEQVDSVQTALLKYEEERRGLEEIAESSQNWSATLQEQAEDLEKQLVRLALEKQKLELEVDTMEDYTGGGLCP